MLYTNKIKYCNFVLSHAKKMNSSKSNLKSRVYEFYEKNIDKGFAYVRDHFLNEGHPKSTIYDHLKSAQLKLPVERKNGSGRPAVIATNANIQKIKRYFDNTSGKPQKKIAEQLNCTRERISQILKKHTNIKRYKKGRKPRRTQCQLKKMRPKCRDLHEKYKNCIFILDDESYFTLNHSTLAGNDHFYSSNPSRCPDHIKSRLISKYEPKLLVWLAASSKGVSEPLILQSGQAINQHIYLEECIKKRLVPFIKAFHRNSKYVFWPDLASSHYAKSVIEYMASEKIRFIRKDENPANVPESRPIENFWGDLKREVYARNWSCQNLVQLERRIRSKLDNMDRKSIQARLSEVHSQLDHIARYGL